MSALHPLDRLAENLSEDERRAFFPAPIDRGYFEAWIEWLSATLDPTPSPKRVDALFHILTQAGFTNAELGLAGDWIVANNERFPVPAHFINCPELGRNLAQAR